MLQKAIPQTDDAACMRYSTNVFHCDCLDRCEHGRYEMSAAPKQRVKRGSYIDPHRGDAICKHIWHKRCLEWYCYDSVIQRHHKKREGIRAQVIDHRAQVHQAALAMPEPPKRKYTQADRKALERLLATAVSA